MVRTVVPWNEELSEIAKARFMAGDSASMVASVIGRKIGQHVSRNAVIGRLHRMGVTREGNAQPTMKLGYGAAVDKPKRTVASDGAKAEAARRKIFAPKPTFKPGKLPVQVIQLPTSWPAKLLADLAKTGECRKPRPDSDPGPGRMDETLYCAAPIPTDDTYCPACKKAMYARTLTPEQRRKAEERAAYMRLAKLTKRRAA